MTHRVIPRSEWGARWGTGWGTRPLPATQAWLHRPAMYGSPDVGSTLEQDAAHVRRIEDVGRARFRDADFDKDGREVWPLPLGSGISYTYVISRSGRIFAGHDPARQSSHTKGHNLAGVGIALADGPDADSPATREQIEACAWLLQELVRTGALTTARLDGGHRDTGFATSCPTAAHAAIPTINALAGGTMSRRFPTTQDFYTLERNLKARGWEITCGPSHVDRGFCAPGKHPHMKDSAHFRRGALDASWPGPPISDIEALHAELLVEEMQRDPHINWRCVWNWGPGDHDDHPHFDDMKQQGWADAVRPRAGVRARDGKDLFVSVLAFPKHVPPTNHGYTLEHMADAQRLLARTLDPATGLPLFRGFVDGYWGDVTSAATKAGQRLVGFTGTDVDGIPGPATLRALRDHLSKPAPTPPLPLPQPTPAPEPAPVPDPEPLPTRLSGVNVPDTSRLVAMQAPRRSKVYLAAPEDAAAAASAGDGLVLQTRRGATNLPGVIALALTDLKPTELVIVGGTTAIPESQARQARRAAGLTL